MLSQAESEADFAAALFDGLAPVGLGPEAEARFDVYRNNVMHGLSRALAQRFPVIEALLGEESFLALARIFIAAEPPASPRLHEWGAGLPGFLDGLAALASHPYLGDVARLEWARGLAWHAGDAEPVGQAALSRAAATAGGVRVGFHPSVKLLETRHAAFSIWAAHHGGETLARIDPMRSEATLILRDPADRIVTEPLGQGDTAMLSGLIGGETLLEALTGAGPGHDPGPLLMRLVRHGAIVRIAQG